MNKVTEYSEVPVCQPVFSDSKMSRSDDEWTFKSFTKKNNVKARKKKRPMKKHVNKIASLIDLSSSPEKGKNNRF